MGTEVENGATRVVEHREGSPGPPQHPLFARFWSRVSGRVVSNKRRAELLAGLKGRVVEVGAGDGRNFTYYPDGLSEIIAIEPEPYLRALAEVAARSAAAPITVIDGTVERMPLGDGSCDAVVSSLLLCSVAHQGDALAELQRVLTPGGELRFFEHVVAEPGLGRAVQHGLDDTGVWPRLGAGCHLTRDTLASIAAAGFSIERSRRFTSGPGTLGIPFVLGVARRPGD